MKIKFNFNFILVCLITIFKYLKMQNIVSNSISNFILLITLILSALFLFFKRKKIKNINKNFFIVLLIMSLLQFIFSKDIDLFLILLMGIIFIEEKDYKNNIIKYYLFSLSAIFITTILLYLNGTLDSAYLSRTLDGKIIQRNSLGFVHPNETFFYFFMILLGIYYKCNKKKTFWTIAIASSYFLYKITLCRTGFICIFFFLLIDLFYPKKLKANKYMFLIGTIVTILLGLLGKNVNNTIHDIFSYRPYFYNYAISSKLIFNIIGNNMAQIGLNRFGFGTIDNAYFNIILSSGILFYLFYLWIYYKSGNSIEKDRKLTKIFLILLIYGCSETHVLNIGLNFLLIIQICTLLKKEKGAKSND